MKITKEIQDFIDCYKCYDTYECISDCSECEENIKRDLFELFEIEKQNTIKHIVKDLIFPMLDEYDIQVWERIDYIDLPKKWVELIGRNETDEETKNELCNWIKNKISESENE